MTLQSKSFVTRVVLGVAALAGVAAAVPAFAHPYDGRDGRDWRNDRGWAERGDGPRYDSARYDSPRYDGPNDDGGYRSDWRPAHNVDRDYGPAYYEGYRPDWRPAHYSDRGYGRVVYVHGHGRRW